MKGENIKWLTLISGILALGAGIYAFAHPKTTLVGLAFYLGVAILISGVLYVFSFFKEEKGSDRNYIKLAIGTMDIVLAFILLSHGLFTAKTLPIIVGGWMVISGAIKLVLAFKVQGSGKMLAVISGLLSFIVGLLFIINPATGAYTIAFFLGGYLTVIGVFYLFSAFRGNR